MDEMPYEDGAEVPQQVADLAHAFTPDHKNGIRACKRCGILKTLDQFLTMGCENCPFLEMVRAYLSHLIFGFVPSDLVNMGSSIRHI